jgi:hypothetical protein
MFHLEPSPRSIEDIMFTLCFFFNYTKCCSLLSQEESKNSFRNERLSSGDVEQSSERSSYSESIRDNEIKDMVRIELFYFFFFILLTYISFQLVTILVLLVAFLFIVLITLPYWFFTVPLVSSWTLSIYPATFCHLQLLAFAILNSSYKISYYLL